VIAVAMEALVFILLIGVIWYFTVNNPQLRWGLLCGAVLVCAGVVSGTLFMEKWVPMITSSISKWFAPTEQGVELKELVKPDAPVRESVPVDKVSLAIDEVKEDLKITTSRVSDWFSKTFASMHPDASLDSVVVEELGDQEGDNEDSKGICGVIMYYLKSRMFAEDPAAVFSQDCTKFNTFSMAFKNFGSFVSNCVSVLGQMVDKCWEWATGRPFFRYESNDV